MPGPKSLGWALHFPQSQWPWRFHFSPSQGNECWCWGWLRFDWISSSKFKLGAGFGRLQMWVLSRICGTRGLLFPTVGPRWIQHSDGQ
jgi:hypothetical protein